jgi:hypothetical protein
LHGQTIFSTETPDVHSLAERVKELPTAGKYEQAIPVAKQILAKNERDLGPEDPITAESVTGLAVFMFRQIAIAH